MNPMQSPNTGVGRNLSNHGRSSGLNTSTGYPRYRVTVDHPIGKRSDLTNMLFSDALKYADELQENGYENITIEKITLDNDS